MTALAVVVSMKTAEAPPPLPPPLAPPDAPPVALWAVKGVRPSLQNVAAKVERLPPRPGLTPHPPPPPEMMTVTTQPPTGANQRVPSGVPMLLLMPVPSDSRAIDVADAVGETLREGERELLTVLLRDVVGDEPKEMLAVMLGESDVETLGVADGGSQATRMTLPAAPAALTAAPPENSVGPNEVRGHVKLTKLLPPPPPPP